MRYGRVPLPARVLAFHRFGRRHAILVNIGPAEMPATPPRFSQCIQHRPGDGLKCDIWWPGLFKRTPKVLNLGCRRRA